MKLPTSRPDRDAVLAGTGVSAARRAAVLLVAMALLGALVGVLWAAWSPTQPPGLVVPGGTETLETEQWIAADGRFAAIGVVLGIFFALLAWRARGTRGAVALLTLAVGGIAGALLTELVGWWIAGGSSGGPVGTRHAQLRLVVHMHGLVFLEALVAVLVYGALVGFAAEDDLGRPDPWQQPPPASEDAGSESTAAELDGVAPANQELPPQ